MDYENLGALDTSIQEKLDADTDFQATLTDLSEDDKAAAVKTKKSELVDQEIKNLSLGSKKSKELADNYKVRAEKAEKELKEKKPATETAAANPELSSKDTIALVNAKVHEDDIDEVVDYAKFKGISIAEALKSNVVKTSIAEKEEKRKSAEAANTGGARRGAIKPTAETLMSNLSKGEAPEKGSKEAEDLFWARRGGKR